MNNRDYFTRSEQGSRSQHDYGYTDLEPVRDPSGWSFMTVITVGVLMWAAGFAWLLGA